MHRDISVPCFVTESLAQAMPYVALAKTILIDEAHRFKNVDWVVPTLAHMGKQVYVSFNSGNTALTPWPGVGELLAHADQIEVRRGTCLSRGCRRNAPFTAPIPTDQRGGAGGLTVGPMCRVCLNHLRLSAITGRPTRPPTRVILAGRAEGRAEDVTRRPALGGPKPRNPDPPRNEGSPPGTIVVASSPKRSIVVDRATLLPGPDVYQELMAGVSEIGSLTLPSFREPSRLVTAARESEGAKGPAGLGPPEPPIDPAEPSAPGRTVYTQDPQRPPTRSVRAKRKRVSATETAPPSTPTDLGSPKRPRRS